MKLQVVNRQAYIAFVRTIAMYDWRVVKGHVQYLNEYGVVIAVQSPSGNYYISR